MKNKKYLIILSFLSLTCGILSSQVNDKNNYVVITFEVSKSIEPKAKDKFYWITPVDSIKEADFCLYPLYLEQYSKDNLDRCSKKDTIDIFTFTTATNFSFNEGYEAGVNLLISLINSKKTKVQTIAIKWDNGYKKDINVYATPITGKFCNCLQSHLAGKNAFKGLIFIPLSDFNFDDIFWKSDQSKKVMFANYATVDFSSHLLLYGKSVRTKLE
jgi:hypothetical protein